MIPNTLIDQIRALSKEERKVLVDMIETMESAPPQKLQPRIPDLSADDVLFISEDFDDPLPDEFWYGQGDPIK
jgi:hypothetical protein